MSKSLESRKQVAERNRKARLERIRAFVFNEKSACPDMSRADGVILFKEIDRLTAERDYQIQVWRDRLATELQAWEKTARQIYGWRPTED